MTYAEMLEALKSSRLLNGWHLWKRYCTTCVQSYNSVYHGYRLQRENRAAHCRGTSIAPGLHHRC